MGGNRDENMREQDGPVGGGMGWKFKERDISIEGAIMGLQRNLMLGKFPGNHKQDP